MDCFIHSTTRQSTAATVTLTEGILKQAINKKENYLEVFQSYSNLGKAYLGLKKYDEAIIAYSHSLEIAPTFTSARFDRGLCYSEMKKYDSAIVDFTKLIALQHSAETFYSRGLAFKNSGKPDEAHADRG